MHCIHMAVELNELTYAFRILRSLYYRIYHEMQMMRGYFPNSELTFFPLGLRGTFSFGVVAVSAFNHTPTSWVGVFPCARTLSTAINPST